MEAAVGVAEHVVEKAVPLAPQRDRRFADVLHRRADVDVVLEEFRRETFVRGVGFRQLERDAHHHEREHPHPSGGVRLLEDGAVGLGINPRDRI